MKIDDFLKIQKVRCIDGAAATITTGKVYDVIGVDKTFVHVTDDNGEEACYWNCRFEPVLDSAENPLKNMKLTPEFEAVEPRFKVGDKVYVGLTGKIETVEYFDIRENEMITQADEVFNANKCCHATTENYERLQDTFPDIEFEHPPLTGSDLARAMLDKCWKYVPCYVSNYGESEAQKPCIVRKFSSSGQFVSEFGFYNNAVPFDPKTGEILTESVLND